MSAPRPHSLLVLLVVVPLALLAWLGVSLHRDSEGRLREATSGIIKERLQIAESHLLEALRDLVTELDSQSSEAVLASVDAEDRTSLVKTARIDEAVGAQSAPQKAMLEGGGQRVTRIDDWQIRNDRPDPQGNASRAVQTFLMAEAGPFWLGETNRQKTAPPAVY